MSLRAHPTEFSVRVDADREADAAARPPPANLTVYRIDFAAVVETAAGERRQVLVEIQKAEYPEDIMRFRRYLGEHYAAPSNLVTGEADESARCPSSPGRPRALPRSADRRSPWSKLARAPAGAPPDHDLLPRPPAGAHRGVGAEGGARAVIGDRLLALELRGAEVPAIERWIPAVAERAGAGAERAPHVPAGRGVPGGQGVHGDHLGLVVPGAGPTARGCPSGAAGSRRTRRCSGGSPRRGSGG